MYGRRTMFMLSTLLAFALCCGQSAHAQAGRVRQLRQPEQRASGLSGRDIKRRTEAAPEPPNETKTPEESSQTSNSRFKARGLNEEPRTTVRHSLDDETITTIIILSMIVLILTSKRV